MNVIHYPCWHSHELWNCLKAYGSNIESCVCSYLTLIKLLKALMYEHFLNVFSRIFLYYKLPNTLLCYTEWESCYNHIVQAETEIRLTKINPPFILALDCNTFGIFFCFPIPTCVVDNFPYRKCSSFNCILWSRTYNVRMVRKISTSFVPKFDDHGDLTVLTIYPNKKCISHA